MGDVTEILTGQGKLYLAVILDVFARMVVGWALSAPNDRHLALRALEQALRRRCPEAGLLHRFAILQTSSKADAVRIATEFMELHRKHWPEFEGESEVRPMFDPGMGP